MALPPPNQTQNMQNMRQYQNFSTNEAVRTAIYAGFMQMQSNLLSKTMLRMIPGSGILQDRAESKKRERYEQTGRDEQGRKLTKQEFEEREKRKKDLGALAYIRDVFEKWQDLGAVPIRFGTEDSDLQFLMERIDANITIMKDFFLGTQVGTQVGTQSYGSNMSLDDVPDRNTTGDNLAAEEQAAEQEREDDQDQLESEARTQRFFTKLFGGLTQGRDRDKEKGGLLGLLSNLLSPITNLFGKGLGGFVKSLIGPIGKAVMGSLTGVIGILGTVMKAMVPFLGTAVLPLLLAGAAGLTVRKFINNKTENVSEAGTRRGLQSRKKKYEVSDGKDGTTLKTAEELGTTDFDIGNNIDETGMSTLPSGERISPQGVDFIKDEQGNVTDILSPTNTKEMQERYKRIASPGMRSMESQDVKAEGAGVLAQFPWIDESLNDLNFKMSQYQSLYDLNLKNIDDPTTGNMLADKWNEIKDQSMGFVDSLDELDKQGPNGKAAAEYGKKLLDIYSNQYGVFADSLFDGKNFVGGYTKAQYLSGGVLMSAKLKLPSEEAGFFGGYATTQGKDDTDLTGTRKSDYDMEKELSSPTPITPPPPSGSDIPSVSNENAALQSAPSAPVSVNTNTSNVNQSNSAVIANGVSARERTGIDNLPWNGSQRAMFA